MFIRNITLAIALAVSVPVMASPLALAQEELSSAQITLPCRPRSMRAVRW